MHYPLAGDLRFFDALTLQKPVLPQHHGLDAEN